MAKTMLRYYLEVTAGASKGRTCALGPDPVLIGSSPATGFMLEDEAVVSEHAIVSQQQGHFWVENLASSGTRVGNQIITKPTLMDVGESFCIGQETEITLLSNQYEAKKSSANIVFPILILLIVVVGILLNVRSYQKKAAAVKAPPGQAEWNEAFSRLHRRLAEWEQRKLVPRSLVDSFAQAWFREQSGDLKGALEQWKILYNAMASMGVPTVTPAGKTIASSAIDSPGTLYSIMGRDWQHDPGAMAAWTNTDRMYASALWSFVCLRIDHVKKKLGQ